MHDEDMISHAGTITGAHDKLIMAFAKAAGLDKIIELARQKPLVIDADFATSLNVDIGREVGRIVHTEVASRQSPAATSPCM